MIVLRFFFFFHRLIKITTEIDTDFFFKGEMSMLSCTPFLLLPITFENDVTKWTMYEKRYNVVTT